jgi:hypothetical protein
MELQIEIWIPTIFVQRRGDIEKLLGRCDGDKLLGGVNAKSLFILRVKRF